MKKIYLLAILWVAIPIFALPAVEDLSTQELVGQTIMPRVVIGKHRVFKKPVQNGEVTGFFIKAHEGHIIFPELTVENQAKFVRKQRKKLIKTLRDLQKWSAKNPRKIPLLLAFDYEGGTVTSPMFMGLKQMPSNMLLAATGNSDLVTQMYAQQAAEIRRVGGNMALGPDADVNSNPANPIIQTRSFGDNAAQVGQYAAAAVKGLQENGVAAVIKHFPGHGDTATDSHFSQPVTNLPFKKLWQTHISAFKPSIDAGAYGVMNNHVVYPQIDNQSTAMFSAAITHDLLRNQMGFKGLVLTDSLDMQGAGDKSMEELVIDGFSAGNDILLLTGSATEIKESAYYPKLAAQWVAAEFEKEKPAFSREELMARVQKILDLKQKLASYDTALPDSENFSQIAHQVAEQGVTLVRDEQSFAAKFAPAQEVCVVMFADGIFSRQIYNFVATLQTAGKNIHYVQFPRAPAKTAGQEIAACVADAQAVIVGSSATSSVHPEQYKLVNTLLENGKKQKVPTALISLLNPYEIPYYPQAMTVLALYGPTADTTTVAAEILLGKRVAKGVLPVELPQEGQLRFEKLVRVNSL